MREGLCSAAVVSSLIAGALFGCSSTDDASPNESAATGGGVAVGGNAATGGAANVGGRTGVGGHTGATGGASSAGGIAQACASACNVLSQTMLTCAPDPCASGCERGYNNAASLPSCQTAYLSLLQCGAQQPASSWSCYSGVIAAPTTGCSAEMNALGGEGLACFTMLAM